MSMYQPTYSQCSCGSFDSERPTGLPQYLDLPQQIPPLPATSAVSQHSPSPLSASQEDDTPRSSPAIKEQREPTGSTITDWLACIEEDGRTYQGYMPEAYVLPNDGEEQERLDLQHHIYRMLLDGGLSAAPVCHPKQGLDIGNGTGIWALQFAEAHKEAQVIGTDLSMIQTVPRCPNCQFYLENSEHSEWVFPNPFDYIHIRAMGPCFDNFMTVIQKCYENMASDGWIELVDGSFELQCTDGTTRGTALEKFLQLCILGGVKLGRDLIESKFYVDYLTHAGFIDVQQLKIPTPIGAWTSDTKSREMGKYMVEALSFAVTSFRKFLVAAGLSSPEMEHLVEGVRRDVRDSSIHGFIDIYHVFGRKPEANGMAQPENGEPSLSQQTI